MGLEVLAIDSGNEKRDLCLNKLGATAFIDFKTSKDLISDVKAATGGLGPHAVIVVAGIAPSLPPAFPYHTQILIRLQLVKSLMLKHQNTSVPGAP